ncbi:MAG TPA: YbhB/YbcL family Raf kinase inhibitor-like protein [Polyangia bacterium]|nr:YbhB/YbcL family Raf kinase inhibitor-like protein [Polyangia bacterium]
MLFRCSSGFLLAALVAAMAAPGCDDGEDLPELSVTSPAFGDGEPIPLRHTCDGDGISPPLWIDDLPEKAATLAVICEDRDGPEGDVVHWVLWGIPADGPGIVEGVPRAAEPGQGLSQGTAADGEPGYFPPCPPEDDGEHRYDFQVYALDASIGLASGATAAQLCSAMDGHVVAQGSLGGTLERE